MLYATGMRVSELVALPAAACRGDPQVLLIRGKGGKERMVPLTPPARAALSAWLAIRDDAPKESPLGRLVAGKGARWLFPAPGAAGHMPRQTFGRLLNDVAVAAGVSPSRVTPHSPPICCKAGPTCAASRPFWATPTWARPRSIPTSWTNGCATWS